MCVQMYILEKKIFRTTLYNTYAIYTNKSRMFYTNILLGISENWFRVVRCDVFPKHPHTQIPHKRNAKNLFNVHMVRTMNAEQQALQRHTSSSSFVYLHYIEYYLLLCENFLATREACGKIACVCM